MLLAQYTYKVSKEERSELEQALRQAVAKRVQIDAERLSIFVNSVEAYQWEGEEAYFRASFCEVSLDGKNLERSNKVYRQIYSALMGHMIGTRRTADPKRLQVLWKK